MKFSFLNPTLGSHSGLNKPDAPVWTLSFTCPGCGTRTEVPVSGRKPAHPVWKITPDPMAMMNSFVAGEDYMQQWARIWDRVTIEPSMQQLPHPRQITCRAHFSVHDGKVIRS